MKKKFARPIRKSAHLSHNAFIRLAKNSRKIENKMTSLIGETNTPIASDNESLDNLLYSDIPQIKPVIPVLPKLGQKPTVTLFVPTLNNQLVYGGIATAIIVAAVIAKKKNFNLRLIQTFKSGSADINTFLRNMGIDFANNIEIGDISPRIHGQHATLTIHPDDLFVASSWGDAYIMDNLPLKNQFIYLIQDFESIFYNNSDEKVAIESTYESSNYIALCNTELMYKHMLTNGFKNVKPGAWFEPAVNKYSKDIQQKKNKKKKMFIYGRPRVKRNLFYTALKSVDLVFSEKLDPLEWEVFMAGQDGLPDISLNSGVVVRNLGKLNIEDYFKLTSEVDLAVSLMLAPHPNYPTLEMASAGAAVVTSGYSVKQDLSNYSDNIFISSPRVENIAATIYQASELSVSDRIHNAKESNINFGWEDALSEPVDHVIRAIKNIR